MYAARPLPLIAVIIIAQVFPVFTKGNMYLSIKVAEVFTNVCFVIRYIRQLTFFKHAYTYKTLKSLKFRQGRNDNKTQGR